MRHKNQERKGHNTEMLEVTHQPRNHMPKVELKFEKSMELKRSGFESN
jgi:hypothetical protein